MTIPNATQDDYERDAAEDYQFLESYDNRHTQVGSAWIRRAVAAERAVEIAEATLDAAYMHLRNVMSMIQSGEADMTALTPQTSTPEPQAES